MNEYRTLFLQLKDAHGNLEGLVQPTQFFNLRVGERNELMAAVKERVAVLMKKDSAPKTAINELK